MPAKPLQYLALVLFTLSCSTKKSIELKLDPVLSKSDLSIIKSNLITYEENMLSSGLSGNGLLIAHLEKPTFAYIKIDENYHPIYIEPGMEMTISLSDEGLIFGGKGSQVNNYLSKVGFIIEAFHNQAFWSLDSSSFSTSIDELKKDLDESYQEFENEFNIREQKLMKARNDLVIINRIQQYRLINQWNYKENDIKDPFESVNDEIPITDQWLELGMIEYAQVLDLFMRLNFHFQNDSSEVKNQAVQSDKAIRANSNVEEIRDYLLAKNISHWLAIEGITPELHHLFGAFKNEFPFSSYIPALNARFEEWRSLSEGRVAPNISGMTFENDSISLTDLRGKITYIDVWATWCGPCIEEFQFYERLIDEVDREKIQFLFLSVDQDRNKWEVFLKSKGAPEGIHTIQIENPLHPSVHESYKIWGIPRYILVDKDGLIINTRAPRPSSEETIGLLNDLTESM